MAVAAVSALASAAQVEPGAADVTWSLTATGEGTHSYTYSWTVAMSAADPSVQFAAGETRQLSFTVTPNRTKTDESFAVTLRGCARNDAASPVTGVVLSLQLQASESAGGPFEDVDGSASDFTIGTVPTGQEVCRTALFGAQSDLYFRNRQTVTSSDGPPAEALSGVITVPTALTGSYDAKASVAETLTSCPAPFTCGPPSVAFPVTFPTPANDPGLTADPFTESVTYTRPVTVPGCDAASGVVGLSVELTELDSGESDGRTAAAATGVSSPGTSCSPPPPPPPPPPPVVSCVVPKLVGKTLGRAKTAIARAHCRVGGITRVRSAKRLKGRIVAQSPKPGARPARGTRVALRVGTGLRR